MTTEQQDIWQDEGSIRQFLRQVGMQESTAPDLFWSSLTVSYGTFGKQMGEAAESIQQGGSAAQFEESPVWLARKTGHPVHGAQQKHKNPVEVRTRGCNLHRPSRKQHVRGERGGFVGFLLRVCPLPERNQE